MLANQGFVLEDTSFKFIIRTVVLMTGGTAFLMWISERISIKGIGNGTSMLIFLNIVAGLPGVLTQAYSSLKGSGNRYNLNVYINNSFCCIYCFNGFSATC